MGVFDTINFNSDEGLKLKRLLTDRLDELSNQLENPQSDERQTALTRGGIMEIKRLLAVAPPRIAPLRYSGHQLDGGNV